MGWLWLFYGGCLGWWLYDGGGAEFMVVAGVTPYT